MRLLINVLLFALAVVIGYLLILSIREPIEFKAEKDRRQTAVVDKLRLIRNMQEFYRDASQDGSFAGNWDTLSHILRTGNFRQIKVIGDPDDPNFTGEIIYDTTFIPIIDTIQSMGIALDSLKFVPFTGGKTFELVADTLTYQSTKVNVVQVSTQMSNFMGPYADPRFAKYDNSYNPNKIIKFGDLSKPSLAGNWE